MLKEIKGDITKIKADVIVNAANTELKHGGGVALAIARAAGGELIRESEEIGYVPIIEKAKRLICLRLNQLWIRLLLKRRKWGIKA